MYLFYEWAEFEKYNRGSFSLQEFTLSGRFYHLRASTIILDLTTALFKNFLTFQRMIN